jgi:hypothetical protein
MKLDCTRFVLKMSADGRDEALPEKREVRDRSGKFTPKP